MTYKIAKSRLPDLEAFQRIVAAYASEMTAWTAHMAEVRAGNAEAYPQPTAPVDVMASISMAMAPNGVASFHPDYEVVDDGPSPEVLLLQKKGKLFGVVTEMERAATNAVLPVGKRRLVMLQTQPVVMKRMKIEAEARDKKNGMEIDNQTAPLTSAEKDILAEDDERKAKLAAIELQAATMHSDIEDLTLDDIDDWKPTKITV